MTQHTSLDTPLLDPVGVGPDHLARAHSRLALLAAAVSGLLRSERPRDYVRELYDALVDDLGIDAYFNFLVDSQDGRTRLRLDSFAGVPDHVAAGFEWLDFGTAVCGMVAAERRERIVPDVQSSTEPVTELIRSLGITAYASFPLMAGDGLVGTLSFGRRDRASFEPQELELLRVLADHVAVAIDRASSHEAERAARRAAEQASAAKSQFLSTMTHELRTPLTAIIGLADLVESDLAGPTTDRQKLHLERIQKAAWHLVTLIDQILDFSRADAGKIGVDSEAVDLAGLADDIVGVMAGEAELKGLRLGLTAPEPVAIRSDGGKIRQILTNLVGNAVRYTSTGSVHVDVEHDDHWVRCRVRDTGPGIPADSLEAIFEPFVQGPGEHTRIGGGTGLGLAVSRRLARLLGGDVDVESTLGDGSSFTLKLPRNGQPHPAGDRGGDGADGASPGRELPTTALLPR
jgi:signal transduction histidine kinase